MTEVDLVVLVINFRNHIHSADPFYPTLNANGNKPIKFIIIVFPVLCQYCINIDLN